MYLTLNTPRLVLRPLVPGDLATTYAYAGDVENTRCMLFLPHKDPAQTKAYLAEAAAEWGKENPARYVFAIALEGKHIGEVSVAVGPAGSGGELSWILHRAYWHRGYAAEAVAAVRDFAFDRLGLGTLYAHCDARNTASARVMERIGMRLADAGGTRTYPRTGETARELAYVMEDPAAGQASP